MAVAVAAITAVAWAVPIVSAEGDRESFSNESSAFAQINGGTKTPITKGQVIASGKRLPDDSCDTPDYKVGMRGDVKSISIIVDEDDCSLVVLDIETNPKWAELEAMFEAQSAGGGASALSGGYKWRAEAVGEYRGYGAGEELTQSTASVEFFTDTFAGGPSDPVHSGSNPYADCWAKYLPISQEVWYWIEDYCYHNGYNLSGPNYIDTTTQGGFHWDNPNYPWWTWYHDILADAAGLGYESGVDRFYADCPVFGDPPPSPASFVCENNWAYLGFY